jgi:GNAT superfamily N-acetyltransferase
VSAPEIRRLERDEIEPHLPMLIADGFTPEIDQGVWLGAFVDGALCGFVRVFDDAGSWMLEDVFVLEPHRRGGLATALIERAREGRDHLWLICDDDTIPFYERRGFALSPKPAFPESLATLYRAKEEWPAGPDHNHNAMCWRAP